MSVGGRRSKRLKERSYGDGLFGAPRLLNKDGSSSRGKDDVEAFPMYMARKASSRSLMVEGVLCARDASKGDRLEEGGTESIRAQRRIGNRRGEGAGNQGGDANMI